MQEKVIQRIGMIKTVTCVIVNHNTSQLTEKALQTFCKFYDIQMILIDNNSQQIDTCYKLKQDFDNVTLLLNNKNLGHGPALHQGILLAQTEYVFTLDSDTETVKGGFLEEMLEKNAYAVGWLRYVNSNGISGNYEQNKSLTPYIHPHAMLLDREKYLTLPKFTNTGSPCNLNMHAVYNKGYKVFDFPINQYIKHLIAGTRRMYGGKWYSNEMPQEWKKNAKYKI